MVISSRVLLASVGDTVVTMAQVVNTVDFVTRYRILLLWRLMVVEVWFHFPLTAMVLYVSAAWLLLTGIPRILVTLGFSRLLPPCH